MALRPPEAGRRPPTQKHMLDNADACFGLCPAELQPLEFPGTVALLQKLG
jgi:hypothetical protein